MFCKKYYIISWKNKYLSFCILCQWYIILLWGTWFPESSSSATSFTTQNHCPKPIFPTQPWSFLEMFYLSYIKNLPQLWYIELPSSSSRDISSLNTIKGKLKTSGREIFKNQQEYKNRPTSTYHPYQFTNSLSLLFLISGKIFAVYTS